MYLSQNGHLVSSRGPAPHPAGAPARQTPVRTHTPVSRYGSLLSRVLNGDNVHATLYSISTIVVRSSLYQPDVVTVPEERSCAETTRITLSRGGGVAEKSSGSRGGRGPSLAMAFNPRSGWSVQTQGYTGTTSPSKDCNPGSPGKSTVKLGSGWKYDKAEAARLAREEAQTGDLKGRTRQTEQGERRAMDAKSPPGAFDTRPLSLRSPKKAGTKKKPSGSQGPTGNKGGEEGPQRGRRRSSSPPPKSFNDQQWCPKTQGFTGRYSWALGK